VTPNAAKLDADLVIDVAGSFNVGEAGRFAVGDFVRLKDGTADSWLEIGQDNGDGTYLYSLEYGSGAVTFRAGTAVVGYGAAGEGGIVLDATSANGPFMNVFTHAGSPWSALTTKARVGNLAGIVDVDLSPTGYGFYSDNAYLKGALVAGGGTVIIDANGIDIDFDPLGAGAAHVRLRDLDDLHDGYVYWYGFPCATAFVEAITSWQNVVGDHAVGATPNAVWIVNVQGDGQSAFSGGAGTGLKIQSWQSPGGTYYGAVLNADDTIARISSYAAAWIDLKPDGHIEMRNYGGGDTVIQLADAAGVSQLEVLDSAGVEVAYVNSDGKVLCALDMHPDSDGRGMFARFVNRLGISTYDDHFRSGVIPAGYAWQGAPFGGTPAILLSYSWKGEYLYYAPAGSTRYFLSRAVTNAAANWQNKNLQGRFDAGGNGRHGLRFDDGSDNNYVQVFATGEANNGTVTVTFQYRAGGGGITTVTSAINMPASEFITLHLRMYYSAPNYSAYGYIVGESGSAIGLTGFSVAVAWAPAAGRAGLFGEDPVAGAANGVECDWFRNEFT